MLIEAERIFVTANPLSELVWTPNKGLGLICTDTISPENKKSLWWNTESFNITLSAANRGLPGDDCHDGTVAEGTMDSMQLVPNSSSKDNIDVNSTGRLVTTSTRTGEPVLGGHDELRGSQEMIEVSMTPKSQQQKEHSEDNEIHTSSCGNCRTNDNLVDTDAEDFDKALYPCDKNSQRICPSSEQGLRISAENIKYILGGTSGVFPDASEVGNKNSQNSQQDKVLDSNIVFKVCDASEKLMLNARIGNEIFEEKKLALEEDSTTKTLAPFLTCAPPLRRQCSITASKMNRIPSNQGSSFFNWFGENGNRVSEPGVSEPTEKVNNQNQEAFGKNQNTAREFGNDLCRRKGKEIVHEEHMDKHEIVESCNGKEFPTAKRACHMEPECESSRRKRLKTVADVNTLGFPFGQDSSFVNWIWDVAKGIPNSFESYRALTHFPEPLNKKLGNSCALVDLAEKGIVDRKTMGFQSFVQALYHPRSNNEQTLTGIQVHDLESSHPNKEASGFIGGNYNMGDNKGGLNLQQPAPLSNLSPGTCHSENPNTIPNSHPNESPDLLKAQNVSAAYPVACNWVSSSSSIRNGCTSAGDEGTDANFSDVPDKPSDVTPKNDRSKFRGSFWVTRLFRKTIPFAYSAQCNESTNTTAERQVDSCKPYVPRDLNVESDCKENMIYKEEILSSPLDSCSLKGMPTDQKPKSNLNPILPSQRLKKLEPMASVFAKRLDAFRHIKPSLVMDDVLFSTVTCFFCGKMGHGLKDCSDIKGSELEDLQKNINSYDGVQKSCLCIRCFQTSHWAIACPLLSKKTNHITLVNDKEIQEQHKNSTFFTIGPARHKTHDKEGLNFKFLQDVGTDIDDRAFRSVQKCADSPGDRKLTGKHIICHSRGMESEGNQIRPVSNFMRREMLDEQICVFERIRGLRLSRTQLVRGMKSHLSLEGFFLRVRFGQNKEGTGRSEYQVACICGELEKSNEDPRRYVSVDIVGVKCSIDFRFVSNKDFIVDELNDWWSAIIRSGRRLPTEEEFAEMLQRRQKANF